MAKGTNPATDGGRTVNANKSVSISLDQNGEIKVKVTPVPTGHPPPTITTVRQDTSATPAASGGNRQMVPKPSPDATTMTAAHRLAPGTPPGTYDVTVECSGQTFTGSITVPGDEQSRPMVHQP